MATKLQQYMDGDAYIATVMHELNSIGPGSSKSEINTTILNVTLLICNMALDHTVPSIAMLERLADIRETIGEEFLRRHGDKVERL